MRRDLLFLAEMIDAAEQAHAIASDTSVERLMSDRRLRDALAWNFTVLGEASGRVSEDVKVRFPDVPWRRPAQLRHRIVHGYWSIDVDLLHATALRDLPGLLIQLRRVLADLESDQDV